MTETLTEMFDRMIKGTKEDTCPAPIGIETSVQARLFDARVPKIEHFELIKHKLMDKGTKRKLPETTRLLFDDAYWHVRNEMVHMTDGGPRATGGIIEFIRADGSKAHE